MNHSSTSSERPRFAQVLATGRYVPQRVVSNQEIEKLLGEPVDAWLREKVGIEQRCLMDDSQCTSDLAVAAAQQAMARAQIKPEQLDLIIVATDTPDYLSPATAAAVQHK